MKKILFIIESSETGGAETLFAHIIERLDRTRFTPHVVLLYPGWLFDHLQQLGIEVELLPTSRGGFDLKLLLGLRQLVRNRGIDLIHSHLLTTNLYASLVGALTKIPVIATFHGTMDVAESDRLKWLKWRLLNRFSQANVFVSSYLKKHFIENGPASEGKAQVIHNGIDFDRFRNLPARQQARASLGLTSASFCVGCIGDLRPAKDYPSALHAAAFLNRQIPGFKLLIAGTPTDLLAELESLRQSLELGNAVEFLGFCPQVEKLLPALDVYLSSSVSEGFSLTVAEAMAAAIPVVATRSGGPEEIVCDGETGLLVPVASPQKIAEAVLSLSHNVARGQAMALAGRQQIAERFTLRRMIENYQLLYDEVLHEKQSSQSYHSRAAV